MTAASKLKVVLSNNDVRSALQSIIDASEQGFEFVNHATVDELLENEPSGIIFDSQSLSTLQASDRALLRKAGIQLLLAYEKGKIGGLVEEVGSDITDFIELPIQQSRFEAQIERTLDIARLRRELTTVKERAEQDADAYDALVSQRTQERNDAENRALQLSRRLSDLDRLKSNLITIISHEFKTPLHLASGYANLLADGSSGELNSEQQSAIEVINRQLERLQNKLQDIERIAQLEMGLSHDTTESVDLAVLLDHEIEGFEAAFSKFKLRSIIDVPHDLPLIRGSQDFLADVFRRLIDNAIHYNTEGGNVEIRASAHTNDDNVEGVLVQVIDTGRGVPEALLPHLFERFGEFRDIEHHSSRQSGLGLGLAICRHLVEMHQGQISATSEVGKGSTFSVFLPTRSE